MTEIHFARVVLNKYKNIGKSVQCLRRCRYLWLSHANHATMKKKFKIAIFSILVLVVVALSLVLVLVSTMPDLPATVKNDNICLPSENGILHCGNTADMLHKYLEWMTSKKYEEIKREDTEKQQKYLDKNRVRLMDIYKKYNWEMKPSAKLTGKDQPKSEIKMNREMTSIKEWRHGRELQDTEGFERYGVRYRNGRLVVPVAGTYLVYSFLNLYETCDSSTGKPNIKNASIPIKHGIFKFNILDEAETEIVSNVQPHVISRNRYFNSYSSYVSSLTELKAGDEISVKVSNMSYLKYTRDNYFGLNLI